VLFGNRHMLAVASTVATREQPFLARHIEEALHLGPSSVHRLLVTLCEVRLLERLPTKTGDRTIEYRRVTHPFWEAALLLLEDARSARGALSLGAGT
jgi:IclR helix-turn-helix domain